FFFSSRRRHTRFSRDWSSDVCSSDLEGSGAYRSMEMALRKAGMSPADIDYINAHGTSTPLGDELELGAVRKLFGGAIADVSMSRSEERRVGKECRSGCLPNAYVSTT